MSLNLEQIRAVFNEDKNEIIGKFGGTGAGIGKSDDQYIIVVYTDDTGKKDESTLAWKNIPVQIKYVGKIKAQT